MELTDYTSYAEIRGVLGVSDDELEDATLALGLYSDNLVQELEDVSLSLPSAFSTVAAIDESGRTDNQQRFYRLTRLFSTYVVAKQLGSSLPMFGPKDITDGKASIARFSDSPYRETKKEINRIYEELRPKLESAYAIMNSSTKNVTVRTLIGVSSMSVDPVTGS